MSKVKEVSACGMSPEREKLAHATPPRGQGKRKPPPPEPQDERGSGGPTRESLRMEVLRLLQENSTLRNQRRQAEYSTARRCAEIADDLSEDENGYVPISVQIADKIRREFNLEPPK